MREVLKTRWKLDRLRSDERTADVELDLRVCDERNVTRVAEVVAAVEERDHVPGRRADSLWTQRLVPDVEEVAERVGALDR